MRSSFTAVLIGCSLLANAQGYLKPRVINYEPGTCNNTYVCEFYNFDLPHRPYNSSDLSTPVSFSDTVYNYCFYPDASNPELAMQGFSTNGYLSHFLLHSSLVTPAYNYDVISFTPATTASSQDGVLILQFDSTVNMNTVVVEQESAYIPLTSFTAANVLEISGLNKDWLTLYLTHPTDTTKYLSTRFYIGNPTEIYVNTGMDVGVSMQHAGASCTGWVTLQANPPGTYYNVWSDGAANSIARTDLCPGIYGIYSYDLLGGYYNTGHIDTVVITNDSLTYIDTNLYSLVPEDTSYYFDVNCTFDFFAPIDSAFYSEDTVLYADPLLIATFELILYQGNNQVTISDSLITLADSTVLLDVILYCDLFKSVFHGQRILFVRGGENHVFVSPYLQTEMDADSPAAVVVYPNPGTGIFNLIFSEPMQRHLEIYSSTGQLIDSDLLVSKQNQIDLLAEPSGIYFLKITDETGTQVLKIILE